MKDTYTENYKILMKELEEDANKWKIAHVNGLNKLILLKCPYYPKQSTELMQLMSKF